MMIRKIILPMLFAVMFLSASYVSADVSLPYDFYNVPQNLNDGNGEIGEDQLHFVVSDEPIYWDGEQYLPVDTSDDDNFINQILFTFYNIDEDNNPLVSDCAITEIYFDDESLGLFHSVADVIDDEDTVDFTEAGEGESVSPFDLLSCTIDFTATEVLSTEYVNGANHSLAIDETDSLGVLFNTTVSLGDIENWLDSGDLLVGIRVHFYTPGSSPDGEEQFVSVPVSVIPAPGAVFLGSIGVGLVGWLRRRKTL